MYKKVILIIVILTSLQLYQIFFLPNIVIRTSRLVGLAIIGAVIVLQAAYSREKLFKSYFTAPIILIFVSVLISMFGAYAFQSQSFIITAYAQRAMYFYLLYLLLHIMKVPGEFIIKCLLTFALLYIGLYLLQYFIYPVQITDAKMGLSRETLRIFLPGGGYLVLGYFIWLYLTFKTFKIKYVIFLLLSITVFILMGSRQAIAGIALVTLVFILHTRLVKSKVLLFIIIGAAFIPIFYLFQDVFYAMFEATREQSQSIESNIRVRAAKFFLTDFFPNKWAYFTGNGAHSYKSLYGLRVLRYRMEYGYYQTDIGLIGEYTQYGFLYVVGSVIILSRVLIKKIPEKLMFIKYYFMNIIIGLVTGAGAFGNSNRIIEICMVLYLVDLYLNDAESLKNYMVTSDS